jgi:hypothetical protein
VLVIMAGLLAVTGSASAWAACSTIGCAGALQALDELSGLEVGFGSATGVAGGLLVLIGIGARRRPDAVWIRPIVAALGLVIVATVTVYLVGVYVLADLWYDAGLDPWLDAYGFPGAGAILAGIGGLLGLGAARRLGLAASF